MRNASTTTATVLTHPAFARTPVVNAKLRGRPPKGVACLAAFRRRPQRLEIDNAVELNRLQNWLREAGWSHFGDLETLRSRKAEKEREVDVYEGPQGDRLRGLDTEIEAIYDAGSALVRQRRQLISQIGASAKQERGRHG